MGIKLRPYDHDRDYAAVDALLIRTHAQESGHRNWVQPRWEYMHSLYFNRDLEAHFSDFGVWEASGEIVAIVHAESQLGVAYAQLDARYPELKRPMLEYAATNLVGETKAGRGIYVYLDDRDPEFGGIARALGFEPRPEYAEPSSRLLIRSPMACPSVPQGFRLQSLADEFDVAKVHRVMHRGFNHEGEPPSEDLEGRRKKLCSPNLRRDLTIVAVAPDGGYVSFCGIWPVPGSTACYIEPVATDPEYRRQGLGTAVVLEAVRRCALEGATVAYVGSEQAFYKSMGFETYMTQTPWWKSTGA